MITLSNASPTCAVPYSFSKHAYAGCWELPEVAMDLRHVYLLHEILCCHPFKSALEIGSFNGASSTAFVEAINKGVGLGESGIATFCDVSPTESLCDVLRSCRHPDRVRLTAQPSWAVLDSKEEFDFVFVDGAHDLDSVTLELSRLKKRKPLCVMAHDTNATAAGYSKCEGAEMLAAEYASSIGFCRTDRIARPGERTDRGLFFFTTDWRIDEKASRIFDKWKNWRKP